MIEVQKNKISLCFIVRIKQLLHFYHFSTFHVSNYMCVVYSLFKRKISNKFYLFIKECNADLITKIAPGDTKKTNSKKNR